MAEFCTGWPRRMQARVAAAYCGVSINTFRRGLGKAVKSWKDGANRFWYKEDLDAALDARKGAQSSDELFKALELEECG